MHSLQKRRGRFTIDEMRFYAAEIIIGIIAMHDMNICHRHLAPEAILISATGHCKIGRLHRARLMTTRPGKFDDDVGVADYKAPEVINSGGKFIFLYWKLK